MSIESRFYKMIDDIVKTFDYDKAFENVVEKDEYVPSDLITLCQATIYHMEKNDTMKQGMSLYLSHTISILRNEHQTRKSLTGLEVQYLIITLKDWNSRVSSVKSETNCRNMYV